MTEVKQQHFHPEEKNVFPEIDQKAKKKKKLEGEREKGKENL